ncbi:hypothetical protein CXT95_08170 [Akkermansia muciniphila]|uniref:Uncharacterized protein n=1 Tax=Akkermansia muciniphila TaxID=239935 RepID=A0AAX0WLP3_9BACT|nr:hypothetical protein CXT95_08170 [Akkermansia muciniphila]
MVHQLFSLPQFPGQKPGRHHDNGHLPFPETELPSTGNLPETLDYRRMGQMPQSDTRPSCI